MVGGSVARPHPPQTPVSAGFGAVAGQAATRYRAGQAATVPLPMLTLRYRFSVCAGQRGCGLVAQTLPVVDLALPDGSRPWTS